MTKLSQRFTGTCALAAILTFAVVAPSSDARLHQAVFWSARTGALNVQSISGDTAVPWSHRLLHLYLTLSDANKAQLLRKLAGMHAQLGFARIDDPPDGVYYQSTSTVMVAFKNRSPASGGTEHPWMSVQMNGYSMRCGPPTCLTPRHFP
jgi:hypothetical protein